MFLQEEVRREADNILQDKDAARVDFSLSSIEDFSYSDMLTYGFIIHTTSNHDYASIENNLKLG